MTLIDAKHRFRPPFANEKDARAAKNCDMPLMMKQDENDGHSTSIFEATKNKLAIPASLSTREEVTTSRVFLSDAKTINGDLTFPPASMTARASI